MMKRSGSLAFGLGTLALVSLTAGPAYAQLVSTSSGSGACPKGATCSCGTSTPTSLSFTTGLGSGNCGSYVTDTGTMVSLGCNKTYIGGGQSLVALFPTPVPDNGKSLTKVSCCKGTSLTLANLTSSDTSSNRNCTSTGCLFGPPLPIPNPISIPASTCVILNVAQNAAGSARCDVGSVNLNIPLTSNNYLDGDLFPRTSTNSQCTGMGTDNCCTGSTTGTCGFANSQCTGSGTDTCCTGSGTGSCTACETSQCTGSGTDSCCTAAGTGSCGFANSQCTGSGADNCCTGSGTGSCVADHCEGGTNAGTCCTMNSDCTGGGFCSVGIQPCPICPGDNTCHGGPNDGMACTPGTLLVTGPQWPTSHDCPPPSAAFIGSIPIPFQLTTGTATKTAVNLIQNNVFCGFCGNPLSADFKNPPVPCTKDAGCSSLKSGCPGPTDPCTACKQRDSGAFHTPSARTITENGAPAGAISAGGSAAAASLASVFCIQPTFNGIVDSAASLPGPGATSLAGQVQLLP